MTKKKQVEEEIEDIDIKDDEEENLPSPDDVVDEDDNEDGDQDDALAEDEDDKAMIAKLEKEDRELSEQTFVLEEVVGLNPLYDWDNRSLISEKEINDAKDWIDLPADELAAIKFKSADKQFKRWLIACGCKRNALHAKFREIATSLIKSTTISKEERLFLDDIYFELTDDFVSTEEYDQALATLDAYVKDKKVKSPDEIAVSRVQAIIFIKQGKIDEAKSLFDRIISSRFNKNIPEFSDDHSMDDAILNGLGEYEVAQLLLAAHLYDLALEYLDKSKRYAQLSNNSELMLSIENTRDYALKAKNAV